MPAKALIASALEHLQSSASVKTVFGEPVQVNGKTVIPVARVASSQSRIPGTPECPPSAKPIGVVEVDRDETRFIAFGQRKRTVWASALASMFGFFAGLILGRRGSERLP